MTVSPPADDFLLSSWGLPREIRVPQQSKNLTEAPRLRLRRIVLVKGTPESLPGRPAIPNRQEPRQDYGTHASRITEFAICADGPRRGWDEAAPWSEAEAYDRAARFWPLALDTVSLWFDRPAALPVRVLLAVPEAGATVVRYAWDLLPDAPWERYAAEHTWGFPLGNPCTRDEGPYGESLLDAVLVEARNGQDVPVLTNYQSGIRVLDL